MENDPDSYNNNSVHNIESHEDRNSITSTNFHRVSTFKVRKRAFSYIVDEKSNLFKIVIPYDFVNKKYSLDLENYQFYDNKAYLENKINEFNLIKYFNMDYEYKFTGLELLFTIIPAVVISIIFVYIFVFIAFSTFFNVGVLIILIYLLYFINYEMGKKRFIKAEKLKMLKIRKILDIENNKKETAEDMRIKWELGKNGYWLELLKLPY